MYIEQDWILSDDDLKLLQDDMTTTTYYTKYTRLADTSSGCRVYTSLSMVRFLCTTCGAPCDLWKESVEGYLRVCSRACRPEASTSTSPR